MKIILKLQRFNDGHASVFNRHWEVLIYPEKSDQILSLNRLVFLCFRYKSFASFAGKFIGRKTDTDKEDLAISVFKKLNIWNALSMLPVLKRALFFQKTNLQKCVTAIV